MRSYRPAALFDEAGRLRPELAALAPEGTRRMSANPHANGGVLRRPLRLPEFADYAVAVPKPGQVAAESTKVLGGYLRDVLRRNAEARNFRIFGPDETVSNRLYGGAGGDRPRLGCRDDPRGRSPRTGRAGDGDPERAHLPGLAGGLSAHRPARLLQLLRGVHPHRRFDVQPARQMAEDQPRRAVAAADQLAQLPAHLACLAAGP